LPGIFETAPHWLGAEIARLEGRVLEGERSTKRPSTTLRIATFCPNEANRYEYAARSTPTGFSKVAMPYMLDAGMATHAGGATS